MGPTEYLLLALVILVPLAIAAAVTLWSLKQVQYRPKQRRPRPSAISDPPASDPASTTSPASSSDPTSA